MEEYDAEGEHQKLKDTNKALNTKSTEVLLVLWNISLYVFP